MAAKVLHRLLLAGACAAVLPAVATASPAAAQAPPPVLPQGADPYAIDPASFTTTIDNPYLPIKPGNRWVYRELDPTGGPPQRIVVKVLRRTRMIDGVRTRVVHDRATSRGKVVEDTFDWYAQDASGNVWYFGEDTTAFANGRRSKHGSWEAGVAGALPGVVMAANPQVGQTYRQEYRKGVAEDQGAVLSVSELADVPFGFYRNVVMTKDYTPVEPRMLEHKFYAAGVGMVLGLGISGGSEREELVRFKAG